MSKTTVFHRLLFLTLVTLLHRHIGNSHLKKTKNKRIRLEVNSETRGWQKGRGNQLHLWKAEETLVMLQ